VRGFGAAIARAEAAADARLLPLLVSGNSGDGKHINATLERLSKEMRAAG